MDTNTLDRMFRLDYSADAGGMVTQGAADYCLRNKHAYKIVDGVDQGYCPRCLMSTAPVMVRQAVTTQGMKVEPGTLIRNFRGEHATLISADRISEPGRSGKVTVEWDKGNTQQYYSTVFDLEVIEVARES